MKYKSARSRNLFVAAWRLVPATGAIRKEAAELTAGRKRKQHKESSQDVSALFFSLLSLQCESHLHCSSEAGIGDVADTTQCRPAAVHIHSIIWNRAPPASPAESNLPGVSSGWKKGQETLGFGFVRELQVRPSCTPEKWSADILSKKTDRLTAAWWDSACVGWNTRCCDVINYPVETETLMAVIDLIYIMCNLPPNLDLIDVRCCTALNETCSRKWGHLSQCDWHSKFQKNKTS